MILLIHTQAKFTRLPPSPRRRLSLGRLSLTIQGEGSHLSVARSMPSPAGGRGTALAVDEEKVRVKLTTNKIRTEPNTSSVRRDIIDPTPSRVPTSATCLVCGLGRATALTSHRDVIHYRVAASLPKRKAFVWGSHITMPSSRTTIL